MLNKRGMQKRGKMADASKMTDDELKEVIDTGVEPEEPESSVDEPVEEAEAESTEPEAEEAEEAQEETAEEETEEKPPSRRETLRIQQLLGKYGPPPERPQPSQSSSQLDYQQLEADPELIKQLEDDRKATGQAQYNAGLEQAKSIQFHTRLEIDAPRVEAKYNFLDTSDKEHFDPVRANAMNTLYLQATGYDAGDPERGVPESVQNPNIRYKDFVEAQMEFAEALLADKQVQTSKNIVKQTAQTGLRPDGSSAKRLNLNQSEKTMNLEELYAAIGQKPPK